jgi:hypothetical protein
MGVCIILTASRFPRALSKRVALELIENENGRTASEKFSDVGFIVEELAARNLTEFVTPN